MEKEKKKFQSVVKKNVSAILAKDNAPILIVFGLFIIIVGIIQPRFLMPMNIRNILIQVSITGIAALAQTMIMISGGIDLSVGWNISFLGCFAAYLLVHVGMPTFFVVLLVVLIALATSSLMGFIISRTDIEPFIISLGFMIIYQGLTYLITRGSEIGIGPQFRFLGKTFLFKIGTPVYIFLGFALVLSLILKYTKFGRRIYAVGSNADAAFLAGIQVPNFKLSVYGISGLMVALAALTQMSRLGTGNPLMGSGREIDVIAAVVVGGTALSGGKGSIWGTVIGIILMGSIKNAMNVIGISPHWQYVFMGVVIILSVTASYLGSNRSSR